MIQSCDAVATEAAVFATRGLEDFAGAADVVWVEEGVVVGVSVCVVAGDGSSGDDGGGGAGAEIGKDVGKGKEDEEEYQVVGGKG